jgi:hypothetical protein
MEADGAGVTAPDHLLLFYDFIHRSFRHFIDFDQSGKAVLSKRVASPSGWLRSFHVTAKHFSVVDDGAKSLGEGIQGLLLNGTWTVAVFDSFLDLLIDLLIDLFF